MTDFPECKIPLLHRVQQGVIFVLGEYPVFFAGSQVGKASVTQEGMFWRVRCQCKASADVPFAIQANWGTETLDLGLCAKSGEELTLTTRINRKKTPQGRPVFRMFAKHRNIADLFAPIRPEEPFAYISKLKDAYLICKGDQKGIMIHLKETTSNQPDSDQTP